jgi:hypothetical protein
MRGPGHRCLPLLPSMSRLSATTFRIHRWLGWIVGLQVLVWVLGGLVFAWLPFDGWVKARDTIQPPVAQLPAGWAERLAPALQEIGAASAVSAVATPRGPALRVVPVRGPTRLLPADGSAWVAPDAAAVQRFAAAMHRQQAPVLDVQRLAQAPVRLGLVDEVGGRQDVWRVRFDDALGSRVYLDGATGVLVAVRTEAWVWYDFFFRLHVMDYSGGEDFNSTLMRVASGVAFALVLAGVVLAVLALQRRWRRRRAHA